jgi:hypothetical protein
MFIIKYEGRERNAKGRNPAHDRRVMMPAFFLKEV